MTDIKSIIGLVGMILAVIGMTQSILLILIYREIKKNKNIWSELEIQFNGFLFDNSSRWHT